MFDFGFKGVTPLCSHQGRYPRDLSACHFEREREILNKRHCRQRNTANAQLGSRAYKFPALA